MLELCKHAHTDRRQNDAKTYFILTLKTRRQHADQKVKDNCATSNRLYEGLWVCHAARLIGSTPHSVCVDTSDEAIDASARVVPYRLQLHR